MTTRRRAGTDRSYRSHARRATVGMLLAAVAIALPHAAVAASRSPTARASLAISVSGLPQGVSAAITISGPHTHATAAGGRTLRGLRPGRYTLEVHAIKLSRAQRGIPAGSVVLPVKRAVKVVVRSGAKSRVKLRYGTIVNARARLFRSPITSVQGDPANPTAITVAASKRPIVGAILTEAPTAKLPAGLFHIVKGVKIKGTRAVLELVPARLDQVFPQLDIDASLQFSPGTIAHARTVSGFDPVNASLGLGGYRCQIPITDSTLTTSESFSVSSVIQLHIPKHFGVPVGLPSGQLSMTLHGSAGFNAFLRKDLGCSASVNLPSLPGAIPVGPVIVPVFLQLGYQSSMTVGDADLRATGSASFDLTAGITFTGTHVTNISSLGGSASASASGALKLSSGPTLRLAVGVDKVADVHFDIEPALSTTVNTDGNCNTDAVLGSAIGISFGIFELNQDLPDLTKTLSRCATPGPSTTTLALQQTGPLGAFPGQTLPFSVRVTNTGPVAAHNVVVHDTLPGDGSFISSAPVGTTGVPAPSGSYGIALGDLQAGQTTVAVVNWKAPSDGATLSNSVTALADNAPATTAATASVPVGTAVACNPCGEVAAGTGLRNRDHGTITISGIPPGATVGRAVLVWAILYDGDTPANTITFQGQPISADVTSSISGNLCWGDSNTVGYAADVTPFVTGNGTFAITDPIRGTTQIDDQPDGVLPYTDGATLLVFYNGGGANNQVLSDFTYDTNTDADSAIDRQFTGINSLGGASTLTLAGPDGQSFGETFAFTGATTETIDDSWDGSDPQDGPSFDIGNLWDTDVYPVGTLLPPGQSTFGFDTQETEDCIGVSAAVLQIPQSP